MTVELRCSVCGEPPWWSLPRAGDLCYEDDGGVLVASTPTMTLGFGTTSAAVRLISVPVCPDLLDYEALGEADGLRGRVVRGFFWLLRFWP